MLTHTTNMTYRNRTQAGRIDRGRTPHGYIRTMAIGMLVTLTAIPATAVANDAYEPNDDLGQEEHFVGGPLRDPDTEGPQVFMLDDAVLGPVDDTDMFAFTAFAGVPIAIRVEPLATGGHSKDARNLGLRLWRRVSAQENTFSLLAQINFNAAGNDEYHPPIVYTLAGYMVAEVYSEDQLNATQPYRLTISNSAIDPTPDGEPAMVISRELTLIEDGDTIFFGSAFIGDSVPAALTLRNNGDAPLTFNTQVEKVGPAANDFILGNLPAQIAPGAFGVFGMNFTPTADGFRQAFITIRSNDPTQPNVTLTLSGIGAIPITDCNGNNIDDADDIANGTSTDCNGNGIPDECELDSDGDGVIDDCEVEEPVQPEPPVDEDPVQEDPDQNDEQDLNGDEPPMPVIEEDPFGNSEENVQDHHEQVVVPVSGFCGAGVAMNVPMMLFCLLAGGAGRRFLTTATRTRK